MSDSFPYDQLPTVPDLSDQIERTTELIGRGGYGSVYKGRWLGAAVNTTPVTVAIKILELVPLRDEARQTKRFKQITRELSLWCSIQHENILPLLGIARINGDTDVPAFVCPWMENGNAKEFCSRNPRFPPILILYDIANGLHYLHTFQPEIVHGDIKAVNVLINSRCEACLCDFGLSRFLTDKTLWKTTTTHAGGTVRWMAPELLNGDAYTPTKESDIYAYAMTCYEILSGDVPFKSVSNDLALVLKVTKGQRPDRIKLFHSNFLWDIITRCWKQEPDDRLRTEKVLGLLRPKVDWKDVDEGPTSTREVTTQTEDIERLKTNLEELSQLLQNKSVLESEVSRLHHLLEEKTMALLSAEEAATKREQLIHDLSATNQRLHEEVRQTKMARGTSTDSKQLSTLLPLTIVNKGDRLSVEMVMDFVRVLNEWIEQASSRILDSLFDQESPGTGEQLEIVWDELNDYIGPWLCNDLKRRSKEPIVEPDPLIWQITFQAGLVSACSRIINDWKPPSRSWDNGLVFYRTYRNIKETNGKAAADVWRTLSRTPVTILRSDYHKASKRYLMELLLMLITAVGGSLESAGILLSQNNKKVEDIATEAVRLYTTITENVRSMKLATFTIPCDTSFDASQMTVVKSESQSGKVICTVGMGLRGMMRDESWKKEEEWEVTMKPKVVLAAALKA